MRIVAKRQTGSILIGARHTDMRVRELKHTPASSPTAEPVRAIILLRRRGALYMMRTGDHNMRTLYYRMRTGYWVRAVGYIAALGLTLLLLGHGKVVGRGRHGVEAAVVMLFLVAMVLLLEMAIHRFEGGRARDVSQ